jgi:hypothetical protein
VRPSKGRAQARLPVRRFRHFDKLSGVHFDRLSGVHFDRLSGVHFDKLSGVHFDGRSGSRLGAAIVVIGLVLLVESLFAELNRSGGTMSQPAATPSTAAIADAALRLGITVHPGPVRLRPALAGAVFSGPARPVTTSGAST